MVVTKKRWQSAVLASSKAFSGTEFEAVVQGTFEKVDKAKLDLAERSGFARRLAEEITGEVKASMSNEEQNRFKDYDMLKVVDAEAQEARNSMRSSLTTIAKEVVKKTQRVFTCFDEPQNSTRQTKQVIEEEYFSAAAAGDALKDNLLAEKAKIIARLDVSFNSALEQVDSLKAALVAKRDDDLKKLDDEIPDTPCDEALTDAFNFASSFLHRLKVEVIEEGNNLKVEDDKRLAAIAADEHRFAKMNMDPTRASYAELLSEKKGILEGRSKHISEIQEFEQLDDDIQGMREQMKNGRIASPPRKRARFWWFGA